MSGRKGFKCPICKESLELDDNITKGEIVYCPDCDEELKIINVDPPKLKRIVEMLEVYNENREYSVDEYEEEHENNSEDILGRINDDIYSGGY